MKALLISFLVCQPFHGDRRENYDQFLGSELQRTFSHEAASAMVKYEADFDAKKEIWDLVILPFWRRTQMGLTTFLPASASLYMSALQEWFASPGKKQTSLPYENHAETFEDFYSRALRHKLSSILSNCEEKQELDTELAMRNVEHEDKEKIEKMEVHVFLKKVNGQKCLQPSEGYVEAAKQALVRLRKEVLNLGSQNSLAKEVQKVEIPEGVALTLQQYTSLAKIIHLLEAEAALAWELLEHDLKNIDEDLNYIDEAKKLLKQIQGVSQLNDGQRSKLVSLVKRFQPRVAEILLDPIETEDSLKLKHDLYMDNQAEEQRQRELAEGSNERAEINQALERLTDNNRHTIPEADVLIRELQHATKMRDDQKERLKVLQAQRSSATRMYTNVWLPISLLWWSGCPLSDGM